MENFYVETKDRFIKSSTSKGNQIKWVKDNKFLKADTLGYESIAEVLATEVEMTIKGFNFVDYKSCNIKEGSLDYFGCVSDIFTKEDESVISIDRVLQRYFGKKQKKIDG